MSIPVIRSRDQLCAYVAQGGQPGYLAFWGHTPAKNGAISKTCFSQWFMSGFDIDGIHYRTAEHFMMAGKARLFEDGAALQRILDAPSPVEVKAIGREIAGYDDRVWCAHRWSVVVNANLGKFSQDQRLKEFLLGTGDQILVEASPVDAIWGIGLAANHPDAVNPAAWQGLNLLGFALMEVRDELRAQAQE
jgi:ribA/ribD-fused uncharacterized protein